MSDKKKNLQHMAQRLASKGRMGDSSLVHMNPQEIQALQAMAGRVMTRNPNTGLPEAFSLWKAIVGGLGAAVGFMVPGAQALIGPSIGLAASSMADGGSGKDTSKEDQAAIVAKKKQQYADAVDGIPVVQTIPSQMPYTPAAPPGVTPEKMQVTRQITGYLKPGEDYNKYAGGGPIMTPASPMSKPDVGLLAGIGAGMDDTIPATVDGQRDVLLSDGEYVVPADVVAHLGDGSTKAGAQRLQEMVQRIRMAKTGKRQQPGKINQKRVMPV